MKSMKKKATVFYSTGSHIDHQVKVSGHGLTKKQRIGEVTPIGGVL